MTELEEDMLVEARAMGRVIIEKFVREHAKELNDYMIETAMVLRVHRADILRYLGELLPEYEGEIVRQAVGQN